MTKKLISIGAEASILQISENSLIKIREPKKYRIEIIDKKIRKFRTKREVKVLVKLKENNISVPKIILHNKDFEFEMELIKGDILKKVLDEKKLKLAFEEIIKIHNLDVIHGDLTTLNMIYSNKKVYIIDFGLSDFSDKIEDKAVDLNLFFNCIKNEHPKEILLKERLLESYIKKVKEGNKIISRLKKVEERGRNK